MAGNSETLGELYARIGINFDDLERNFVQVDRTLRDNMSRLNRQRNLINLQAQVDLTGLDAAADATQIFQIRQRALQQQIETQQARVRVLSNVLDDARNRTGELSDETQRAQIQYEQARLALRRLETQLSNLSETQNGATNAAVSWTDAIKNVVESGRVIGALENIQGVISAIADETTRSLEKFKELEKQAYELNMPFQRARNFLPQVRLAGGDIGDWEGFVRGISDAMIKGEYDDPEAMVFRRYNESAFDASGHIKNFEEMTATIKRMYDQAKAAGEEIEFLQMLGGESGVRDAIQLLERWNESQEDNAKIFKSGIDENEMHKAERSVALLTEQFEELRNEVANLFTPSVIETADKFFKIFRDSTKWIHENNAAIRQTSSALAKGFTSTPLVQPFKNIWDSITAPDEKTVESIADQAVESMRQAENIFSKAQKMFTSGDSQLSQYGIQRINQFKEELEDLRLELDYESEFERKIAELDLWKQRELDNKNYVSKDERLAVEELYAAKREQIERETEERLEDIRKSVNSEFQSELENRLAKIEEERDAWINAGMAEVEAAELAEKRKSAAIQAEMEKVQQIQAEFTEHINSIYQTQLEQRLAQIEKEKQAWIQKGIDEVNATRAAEEQKVQAQRNAAMSLLKSQLQEYRAFQEGSYEGLRDYQLNQLYQSGIRPEDLQITPQQLANFQKAQQIAQNSLLPNFMTDADKYNHNLLRQAQAQQEAMQRDALAQQKLNLALGDAGQNINLDGFLKNILDGIHIQDFDDKITVDLTDALQNVKTGFDNFDADIADVTNRLSEMIEPIAGVSENFSSVNENLLEFSDKLSKVSESLQALPEKQPVNVEANVSIEEAHAWDTEHIQELADKVADVLLPKLVSAIGGDSNSY